MRVVAIAARKGGCAKSTTAVNLAASLAFIGKRTLLVDLDPNGDATAALGLTEAVAPESLADILGPNDAPGEARSLAGCIVKRSNMFHLVPAGRGLADLDARLGEPDRAAQAFEQSLAPLAGAYDFTLIDCAMAWPKLRRAALAAAGEILIPLEASPFGPRALGAMLAEIVTLELRGGPRHVIHAVAANLDEQSEAAAVSMGKLRAMLNGELFNARLRRDPRIVEATAAGKPIADWDREAESFKDHMACAAELIQRGARRPAVPEARWSPASPGQPIPKPQSKPISSG